MYGTDTVAARCIVTDWPGQCRDMISPDREVPVDASASFELIRGNGNASIFADAIRLTADAAERNAAVHFHPQVELVWFRKVAGTVWFEGASYPVADGQAVLLPSMQVHSFQTGLGPRDWVLLQFEPYVVEPLLRHSSILASNRPMILTPDAETAARIDILSGWLCRVLAFPDRSVEAQQILHLILTLLAARSASSQAATGDIAPLSVPYKDVLRQIHADPRRAPDLAAAAQSARVTAAYFARSFKSKVGIGYAAYVQIHRLNTAARLLRTETTPVSQIAYQVGFSSAAHFSTAFAERFGQSPRSFRLQGNSHSAEQDSACE